MVGGGMQLRSLPISSGVSAVMLVCEVTILAEENINTPTVIMTANPSISFFLTSKL